MKNFKLIKVVGIGPSPSNFTLNLKREELLNLSVNLNEIESLKDLEKIFVNDDLRLRLMLDSNLFISSLLFFINKTSRFKLNTEQIIINKTRADFYPLLRSLNLFEDENLIKRNSNLYSDRISLIIKIDGKQEKLIQEGYFMNYKEFAKEIGLEKIKDLKEMSIEQKSSNNDSTVTFSLRKEELNLNKSVEFVQRNPDLLSKIKFDPDCEFIFLDLNDFHKNKWITLSDVSKFLNNLSLNDKKKFITLIFPNSINRTDACLLISLMSVADYIIFEKRDAWKLISLLDVNANKKNFIERLISLKLPERRQLKNKRTFFLIDEFNKLDVITEDIEKNIVKFIKEYEFNYGGKKNFLKVISSHYNHFKSIFFGGFFSSIMANLPFDQAFEIGKTLVEKIIESVKFNNYWRNYITIYNDNITKFQDPSRNHKEFIIDSVDKKKSELKFYNPLKDKNLKRYFSNPKIIINLHKSGINERNNPPNQMSNNSLSRIKSKDFLEPSLKSYYNNIKPFEKANPGIIHRNTLPKLQIVKNNLNSVVINNNRILPYPKLNISENVIHKSKTKLIENPADLMSLSPKLAGNESTKKNKTIKKYVIKLNEGYPIQPDFVVRKLREKPIQEKDNYCNDTPGVKENQFDNENVCNVSPIKDAKKPNINRSPTKNKNGGVTIIIQDI